MIYVSIQPAGDNLFSILFPLIFTFFCFLFFPFLFLVHLEKNWEGIIITASVQAKLSGAEESFKLQLNRNLYCYSRDCKDKLWMRYPKRLSARKLSSFPRYEPARSRL